MAYSLQELRTKEKNFEESIEAFFISPEGGYKKGSNSFDPKYGIYKSSLLNFVKETQPKVRKTYELPRELTRVRPSALTNGKK